MPDVRNVPFDDFTASPGRVIDSIPLRGVIVLTHHGAPLARMTRLPGERAEIDRLLPEGAEALSVGAARTGTFDRVRALKLGAVFVLGRGGRREALIEGVRA